VVLCSTLVVEATEASSRMKTRIFLRVVFSRGISGLSTSTMVFKIQALTRRIGFTIKQWVFYMEFMDMSTHLEIFHQESHFTSEFAVVPPSVLDILLPAPFWGRQQVVVHSSEEGGLTTSSSYIPLWIISSGFQEDEAPSRMDHPLQSWFLLPT